ncbi:uncharacterized protein L201_004625 [Kwoniella dendrophila CBS 6074]|uniref:Uncharacterized protein n=1 Tax=Kwoniella dendrophila CBS 6074 TaxID=1295534 RepID=A0AAX4JYQ9_9TREE
MSSNRPRYSNTTIAKSRKSTSFADRSLNISSSSLMTTPISRSIRSSTGIRSSSKPSIYTPYDGFASSHSSASTEGGDRDRKIRKVLQDELNKENTKTNFPVENGIKENNVRKVLQDNSVSSNKENWNVHSKKTMMRITKENSTDIIKSTRASDAGLVLLSKVEEKYSKLERMLEGYKQDTQNQISSLRDQVMNLQNENIELKAHNLLILSNQSFMPPTNNPPEHSPINSATEEDKKTTYVITSRMKLKQAEWEKNLQAENENRKRKRSLVDEENVEVGNDAEMKITKEENEKLWSALTATKTSLDNLKEKYDVFIQEQNDLRSRIQSLENMNDLLKAELEKQKKEFQILKGDQRDSALISDDTRSRVKSLESRVPLIQDRLGKLEEGKEIGETSLMV